MNAKFPKYMRFWIYMTSSECNGEIKRRYRSLPVGSALRLNLQVLGMKCQLQMPFFGYRRSSKTNNSINSIGFNAIKILVNKSENTSAIINSLTNNLVNTNRSNVSILVHLISTSSDNDDIPVRAMSNTTIILAFSEKRTSVTP